MKKVRKMKRIMVVLMSVFMIAAVFAGCGKKPEIDPVRVIQAVMDAELKGDVDEYVKLSGEEKEDVLAIYDEAVEGLADELATEFEILGAAPAEDELKELAKKMLASAKYEVQDAEKDEDDNYTVNVAVYPSDLIRTTIQTAFKKMMENPGSIANLEAEFGSLMMDAYNEGIENQTYGGAEIYTVRLTHDDDYQYSPNEEDLVALGSALYAFPEELVVGSGKDYGNIYLNWMKEDWQAATDDEKVNCCLEMVRTIFGFTEEEMAMVDKSDPTLQEGVQMMMDGIEEVYDSGLNMSVGDFTEYMMSMGMDFAE